MADLVLHDIYNPQAEIQRQLLNGHLPVQAMLFDMPDDWLLFSEHYEDLQLQRLAFFHKDSLELLCQHSEVLLLDATYKINHFNLPMMNVVGQNSMNRTFYTGGTFMKENKENFTWFFELI